MKKCCPICDKKEWDYDVNDGVFTFCGKCHHEMRKTSSYFRFHDTMKFSDYLRAVADTRDNHNRRMA